MRNGREKQGRIKSGIPKMDPKEFWREPRKWKGEKKNQRNNTRKSQQLKHVNF